LLAFVSAAASFPLAMGKPNWLANGLYVTYEQFFVWADHSETANMTWRIIRIEGDHIDIRVTSYTLNASDGALNIIPISSNFTINSDTREILSSSEPTTIGSKWFFWIETDVTLGSNVDTGFGVASISGSEVMSFLGQQRDTWVVEYNWPTSYMKRWYDKASGIVLKIYVVMQRASTQVQVTETARWTNINLPTSESGQSIPPWMGMLAFAFVIGIVFVGIATALKLKRRHRNQKVKVDITTKGLLVENLSDV